MSYIFVTDITKEEYRAYLSSFSGAPIFQSPAWAKVKSSWSSVYIGVRDKDGAIVCASLMLIRRIAPGLSFGYCNRGPLVDYGNEEVLRVFTEGLKKYAKSKGLCYVKFDPLIPVNVTPPELKDELYLDLYKGNEESYGKASDLLASLGYTHKGFGKDLSDYIQPRYNMIVPLKNRAGKPLSSDELKKNFRQSIRKYVGSFADNRGIFTEIPDVTDEVLEEFTRLIHSTEERQGIYLRGKEYFKQLTEAYGEDAKIILAKCHVNVYREYLESRLKNEPENQAKISELIQEADDVIAKNGETVSLAGLLVVFPPNKEGEKTAEYLYAGADLSIFSSFNITMIGLYDAMKYCIERGCDMLNLGGVEGTLDDGLYEFKARFGSFLVEYYGEYDLIVSPLKYKLLEKYLPTAVRVYKKIVRKLTGTENKNR